MPDVSSIGHGSVSPLNRGAGSSSASSNGVHRTQREDTNSDRVELSDHARLLDQIRRMPDVRTDRVEQVREAIARGEYETEERLNEAVERLVDELS